MDTRTGFVVFLIGSVMAAVIAGLLAALLDASGLVIIGSAAATFTGILSLSMTAFHFVRQPPAAP